MSARPESSCPESSDPFDNTQEMKSSNTPAATNNNGIDRTHAFTSRDPSIDKKPRTMADLRAARESRANEALKMKDEQLRILQDQNNQLLGNLDRVEEEATHIQQERLTVEEENRTLRETIFESQGRARAAEAALKKVQAEEADREKQLRIMTDQNAELLRLLEQEEAQAAALGATNESALKELEALRAKYASLLTTARSHEEMAGRAAREGQLRAEEVRILRAEVEQIKNHNSELKMKTQVELESLQEQLRVRKEKQYQLLEKLQGQEEAKRQAEDQVSGMEDKLRALHTKSLELETQFQVEARGRRSAEEANRDLVTDAENARQSLRELQGKVNKSESERMRMEIEARDSGEQLREMAEKVFQLLERLKLAELAKNKAIEALRHKDQEVVTLKQKNSRLVKESTKEGKSRVKVELDLKVSQDQVAALKKHNAQLACRCREETKAKIKEHDERLETQEKVRTLGGRLSFLLNKMQSDEEARVLLKEEAKKTEAQMKTLTARARELQRKLEEAGESNRIITQAVRLKQDEVDKLSIANEAISRRLKEKDPTAAMPGEERPEVEANGSINDGSGGCGDGTDTRDINSIHATGGKGVFYVESRPAQGLLLMKAKRPRDRDWLDDREVNAFLKRAQKTPRFKELAVERFCQVYGLLLVEEEERKSKETELSGRTEQLELMCRKNAYLQDKVATEEEAKRRTLLRYIHAVKAASSPSPVGSDKHHDQLHRATAAAVGTPGRGILQLPESGVTDEEVHAIAALLRGNSTIAELNLRGNEVTDDGAAAIGAVLAGRIGLRSVDLRGNRISKQGIRTIAESLERSERVRHVYVHAGGKVEALGTGVWAAPRGSSGAPGAPVTATEAAGSDLVPPDPKLSNLRSSANPPDGGGMTMVPLVTVETVCVVDMRENTPPDNGNGGIFSAAGSASLAIAMDDPAAPLPPGLAIGSSSSLFLSSSSIGGTKGGRGRAVAGAKGPVFATSVLPGELCARGSPVSKLGAGVRGSRGRGSDKIAAKIKREASEQRRAEKREREREERRYKQMELGWTGRNGGLDTRPKSNCSSIGSGGTGNGGGDRAKAGGGGGGNLPYVGATNRGYRQGHHRPSRGHRREDESEDESLVGTPKTRIARINA